MKFKSLFAHTDRTRLTDGTYSIMKDLATVNIGEQNNSVVISVDVLALSCAEMKQI